MPHDIPLDKVATFDELLGRCPEATTIIRNAIENVLRTQARRYTQLNQREVYAEVEMRLWQYQARATSKKFFASPNRAGWLYLFSRNWTRNWLRERIRIANGDERIRRQVETEVIPANSFTADQQRQAAENESLHFDVWQFARNRGCGPHVDRDDYHARDCFDSRVVEEQSLSEADAEKIATIRAEVAKLPPEDGEFFLDYVERRYRGHRTPADRKRFERLKKRVRDAVTTTAKVTIKA